MNRVCGYVFGALAIGLLAGSASAQEAMRAQSTAPVATAPAPGYNGCCEASGDQCCGDSHWLIDLEMTFLKLHRSDDFDDNDDVFGFETAPRLTVGYVGASGLGGRLRWWKYDHANREGDGSLIAVDTYNLDLELFESYNLGKCTCLELSAGVRYNDFDMIDDNEEDRNIFDALGIVVGAKVTRQVAAHGALYARVRHAWLMGDTDELETTDDSFDVTYTQFEGGVGYEHTCCLRNGSVLTLRAGVEMQHWAGYDDFDDDDEAIGFGGFVLGAALSY